MEMAELARFNGLVPESEVPTSGTSGPSESEILQKLPKSAKQNSWATNFLANPRLVAARPQGNDSTDDTPPAGPMI